MILRPAADIDLNATITTICGDVRLSLDGRAMLALMLADRRRKYCPTKARLASILAERELRALGRERINRMVREAEALGYMARTTWRVPHKGHAPAYSFILGLPNDVAAMLRASGVAP